MKFLRQVENLTGKKVIMRVDFDVPVSSDGKIEEVFRIEKQKEAINYLRDNGAVVTLVAHISDPDAKSFSSIIAQLNLIIGHDVVLLKDLSEIHTQGSSLKLLDNVRQWDGEEKNDDNFAKQLANGFDLYVNDAFSVCHRAHASVSAITKFLPSYAGPLLESEINNLKKAIDAPAKGKIIIMGGAKASTKIPVVKNLIDRTEYVLIGGVLGNDILKKNGLAVGNVDDNYEELLADLDTSDKRIIIATDYLMSDGKIFDIGDQTIAKFSDYVVNAEMVIWNGPLGLFEQAGFERGTNSIAQAIASSRAVKIIGGGDTIRAVDQLGLINKFDFVSTGGGAMLEFLSGKKMPGLESLN